MGIVVMSIEVVWSWPAVIASTIAGAAYSLFFIFSFLVLRRRKGYPFVVGVNVLVGTFVFTVSQVIAALWIGDPFWFRVGSRYGMWVPFAAALVACITLAMRYQRGKGTGR